MKRVRLHDSTNEEVTGTGCKPNDEKDESGGTGRIKGYNGKGKKKKIEGSGSAKRTKGHIKGWSDSGGSGRLSSRLGGGPYSTHTKHIGRPSFKPTDEQRRIVYTMAAYGIGVIKISKALGIHHTTLLKHFREELDEAIAIRNQTVESQAYRMAISGNHVGMTIFWLKTQCKWKEPKVEIDGKIDHQHSYIDEFRSRIAGIAARIREEETRRTIN